jgi:hypothetical protein
MDKRWFWDWHHDAILAAFVLGLASYIVGQIMADRASGALGAAVLVPLALVAVKRISAFFQTPPADEAGALKQGQSGFTRVSVLGTTALVGVLAICLVPGIVRQRARTDAPIVGQGCSWFTANQPAVISDLGQIGSCVLAQLFRGVPDPLAIATVCLPATVADVEQVIASLIDFYDTPSAGGDAGTPSDTAISGGDRPGPMLCGSKAPPKGLDDAPQCIPLAQVAHLHMMHARAKAKLAAGAH